MSASGTATPRSKLDQLSKDELIRFAKKQVQNLQTVKKKIEEYEINACTLEQEKSQLMDKNQQLVDQMDDQKQLLDTFEIDRQNAEVIINQLKNDNEMLCRLDTSRNEDIEKLNSELAILQQQLHLSDERVKSTEMEIQKLLHEIAVHEGILCEKSKIINEMQDECQFLGSELNDKMDSTIGKEMKTSECHSSVADLAHQKEMVENWQTESKRLQERLTIESSESQQKSTIISQLNRISGHLGANFVNTNLDGTKIYTNCSETQTENENKHNDDEDIRTRFNEQLQEIELLITELDNVKQLHREQTTLVDQLKCQSEQKLEEFSKLSRESNVYKNDLDTLKEKLSRQAVVSLEMADYERSIGQLQKQLKQTDQLVQSKSNEVHELTKELEVLRSQKTKNDENLAKSKNESDQYREEIGRMNVELNQKKEELSEIDNKYQQTTAEAESFKTRAHSVLKQQNKSKNDDEQKLKLEMVVDDLENKLRDAKSAARIIQDELSSIQDDYEHVNEQLTREKTAHDELQRNVDRSTAIRMDLEARLTSQSLTNDRLLKQQRQLQMEHVSALDKLKEMHISELSDLKDRLNKAESCLSSRQNEKHQEAEPVVEIPPTNERMPAEGHEAVQVSWKQDRVRHRSHLDIESLSLDQLLTADDDHLTKQSPDQHDQYELTATDKVSFYRRLGHSNELLHEAEAANARLVEQIGLLKREVRRLERNQERQSHLANYEYLKNVIMKFLAPEKVEDERPQLIPVLTTMLRLGPDEVAQLNAVAYGQLACQV